MKEYMTASEGATALGAMVLSCGNLEDCDLMLKRLFAVDKPVPLRELGEDPEGHWYNPFRAVYEYVATNMPQIDTIGAAEVAATFGGQVHAEKKFLYELSTLKPIMGPDLGFLLHVGMPLGEDLVYRNGGFTLKFASLIDLGGTGVPYAHLGVVIRLPITPEQSQKILADQLGYKPFQEALARCSGQTVRLPENYLEATRLTLKAARE